MGRPLYSTLLTTRRVTEQAATQPSPPTENATAQTECPVIEKWSRWNAFDPDSDEFFQAEDAVYEAFLTEEEITARDEAQRYERLTARRIMDVLGHADISNDGQPNAGVWSDTDVQLVASPRPMSYVLDGSEASSERQPTTSTNNSTPVATNVRAGTSVTSRSLALANLLSEEHSQPDIPVLSSTRNVSPVPNTPARISGFFSPRRRTYAGMRPVVDPPASRRGDIRIVPAPEPLTS